MKKADLQSKWFEGSPMLQAELAGTYKITMYPRWLWWWFKNVKVIAKGTGINRAFGFIKWASFNISVVRESCLLLNYSTARWPWKGIRDYVRCIRGVEAIVMGWYIGKFYYIFPFIGAKQVLWFTMERQREESHESTNS